MARFILTRQSDGSVYLQCRCATVGRPCSYEGEIAFSSEGISLERRARLEAFDHCWAEHGVPSYQVQFEISQPLAESTATNFTNVSELIRELHQKRDAESLRLMRKKIA